MVAHNSPTKEGPHLVSREDNFITKKLPKTLETTRGEGKVLLPFLLSLLCYFLLLH